MAKSGNQKLKVLHLWDILQRETDEKHPMSMDALMAALAARGVEVRDRKSLYDDIEALRVFGLDIILERQGRSAGYYVAGRPFELAELKLLVDAVQSSRFITHKKTGELIAKVSALASRHQGGELKRQTFVAGRIKAMNESIFYNVDALSGAITGGRQISFLYNEWQLNWGGERVSSSPRRQGARYEAGPWALCWAEENYYLVAWEGGRLKHFRVDKMQDIKVLPDVRQGGEAMESFDPAEYCARMFGMFGGEGTRVKLRFDNRLIGVVVDRFGRDIFLTREDERHFAATVEVALSPQFLAWVLSFGREAKVLSPPEVAEAVRALALEALEN